MLAKEFNSGLFDYDLQTTLRASENQIAALDPTRQTDSDTRGSTAGFSKTLQANPQSHGTTITQEIEVRKGG
jgi:hypothetical protein